MQAWNYSVMPQANPWPWMNAADNGLNPGPTPEPPAKGLEVKLSTGPNGRCLFTRQGVTDIGPE